VLALDIRALLISSSQETMHGDVKSMSIILTLKALELAKVHVQHTVKKQRL
jgi:hypothetical protein